MKKQILLALLVISGFALKAQQKVIELYNGAAPGSESWAYNEKETTSPYRAAYNVSHPTLTAYLPDPAIATGTGVIICPGGGFFILSMDSEGVDVAKWLNKKGIAAFVLKYRLGQSSTDKPVEELAGKMFQSNFPDMMKPIIPLAVADGRAAIKYVRTHAGEFNISPSRVGIMGFSAGGTVTASAAFNYTPENRPDFVAPIYPYMPPELIKTVPADAPPMFICVASDDQFGLVPHSQALYNKWQENKHIAELHIYEKGGHGFGMHKQSIPTDTWIDRFGDWLGQQGLLKPIEPKAAVNIAQRQYDYEHRYDGLLKDWANIKRYEADNSKLAAPAAGENRAVYMGDSITDFWIYNDSLFFANNHYIDRGISGQTTGQMLVRFREDVINLKPKVVVILAGINDIAENNGPSKLEDVMGNIASMAELAKAANIKVVLSSVLPASAFPWRPAIKPAEKVKELNAMIKAYAVKNHLVYLDYYTPMVNSEGGLSPNLAKDGVHPTLEGYKIMEPMAVKAIETAMKTRQ
ncbi:GDSL-type esterase/lipase family protein [Mucilaginibacter sp. L3T2-6]|uniref:GDSL-type esterase/lipase family protein n=1 Tax=Mucilaginibacter sp. L3T2-6 TaxID=3062491 RepID=UPI0026754A92|nr:GDSL-type esterase/lipase family protein [Mucilaginibacter sp. L3T2-6]MDO3644755.1 GDSL-type esterase/lipase family protein [Mucilaginibacter sp. L3T2-6]MDV6217209.1 GDSL-type esterase/lipase family protein [Mucilaginibacter sp. L3T2-6]